MLNINDFAPEFSAIDENNNIISLAIFKNSNIVLFFYPKDNTPGCTIEAMNFSRLVPEFAKYNTNVVGISADSSSCHRNFISSKDLNIKLISDADKSVAKLYHVLKEKSIFNKKYTSISRSTFLINNHCRIVKIWHNVIVEHHASFVLEEVKKLQLQQTM